MKEKIYISFIICFFIINNSFADEDCEIMNGFKKYQCRSKQNCEKYNDNKKVFNPIKYQSAEKLEDIDGLNDFTMVTKQDDNKILKNAVGIYKNNMNDTYKCGIIQVQQNSLKKIKDKFLRLDKTLSVKSQIEPRINDLLKKLDDISKNSKCVYIDKKTVYNKLSILKQTTNLTCDYNFYMEYLKEYFEDPKNMMDNDGEDKQYSIPDMSKKMGSIKTDIDSEVNQAYEIFSFANQAYNEYENYYTLHFLLELLKEDYAVFRDKLNNALNPINQVVYKISNAMKK